MAVGYYEIANMIPAAARSRNGEYASHTWAWLSAAAKQDNAVLAALIVPRAEFYADPMKAALGETDIARTVAFLGFSKSIAQKIAKANAWTLEDILEIAGHTRKAESANRKAAAMGSRHVLAVLENPSISLAWRYCVAHSVSLAESAYGAWQRRAAALKSMQEFGSVDSVQRTAKRAKQLEDATMRNSAATAVWIASSPDDYAARYPDTLANLSEYADNNPGLAQRAIDNAIAFVKAHPNLFKTSP